MDEIKKRLEDSRRELSQIALQREEILMREAEVTKTVSALQLILSKEPGYNETSRLKGPQSPIPSEEEKPSVAQAAKDIIKASGAVGISYNDLAGRLRSQGFSFGSNYVYSMASSLKGHGEARVVNGRIIWQEVAQAK